MQRAIGRASPVDKPSIEGNRDSLKDGRVRKIACKDDVCSPNPGIYSYILIAMVQHQAAHHAASSSLQIVLTAMA